MIFSRGYNLKKSTFFKNFSYISLYGALGTIMTFGIIFGLTYLINKLGKLPLIQNGFESGETLIIKLSSQQL